MYICECMYVIALVDMQRILWLLVCICILFRSLFFNFKNFTKLIILSKHANANTQMHTHAYTCKHTHSYILIIYTATRCGFIQGNANVEFLTHRNYTN